MTCKARIVVTFVLVTCVAFACRAGASLVPVDMAEYSADSRVTVTQEDERLRAVWPIGNGQYGAMSLRLADEGPLIEQLAVGQNAEGPFATVLENVDPALVLTVGTRNLERRGGWTVFFDSPPDRPYERFKAQLQKEAVRVVSQGRRTSIIIDGLSAGPFEGDLRFTFYPGGQIVQAEAVMSTQRNATAFLYDAGLTSPSPSWDAIAWLGNDDQWHRAAAGELREAEPVVVRHRAIIAESGEGSVAIFPPPHQYLYPLDFADNFGFVWHGHGWQNLLNEPGFGLRQPPEGDKRHVPWVNAPPGTQQRMGAFYLLSSGSAGDALDQVRQYTRGDHFKPLDGYLTFASHFHVEHALDLEAKRSVQNTQQIPEGLQEPGFVKAFKAHGIDIVHLAEFHVRHTPEFTARRLALLKMLHEECERLSDDEFLLVPGEEPNVHLGGHWISLFPRPVYWMLNRLEDQPFKEEVEEYGTVYHVGSPEDVLRLMEEEQGLMWTAHPRIKGSTGFPDRYRQQPFFASDRFLGAAWKAMPADYAQPRLGSRVLDLMDDMANWGLRKYVLGEVDVFKVNPDYELYGHMNINYVKLDQVPRFSEGWQALVDALHNGEFFVTTGEILIPSFTAGGQSSGQVLESPQNGPVQIKAQLEWTFPLAFAEVISGDRDNVYRHRVDLTDTQAFGSRELIIPVELGGRKWVRLEVWDVAANGAFTQPVWIEPSSTPDRP